MKKPKQKKVKFGELEDKVMLCVWDLSTKENDYLVDVRTIIQALAERNIERKYVYTTIHTTCLRLCKKKKLDKVQIKNKYFYKPSDSKESSFKKEIETITNKYFEGNAKKALEMIKEVLK